MSAEIVAEMRRVTQYPEERRASTSSEAAASPVDRLRPGAMRIAGRTASRRQTRSQRGCCRSATGPASRPAITRRMPLRSPPIAIWATLDRRLQDRTDPLSEAHARPPLPDLPRLRRLPRQCRAHARRWSPTFRDKAATVERGGSEEARERHRLARQAAAARAAGAAARPRLALPRDRPVRRLGHV